MRNLEEYNSVLEARSKRLDDLYERAEKVAEALNAKEVEFPLGAANEIGMLAKMSGLIFSTVATFDEAKGDTTLDQNYLDSWAPRSTK
ncbi:hypothetical protein JCM19235_1936 [Vibrio maritimus]|uniref:Uncharacterized protein n=1 Tax=Vibrio maritimus TaxID=990268 RepID=A0A090RVF6_9VIBR|nr:hypothetical protein JCM19235_1936 [Vibrio maritimus]